MGEAKQQTQKAARSWWGKGLARWGLVSRDALYVLVGAMAVHVSIGGAERVRDRGGALAVVTDTWPGKILIALVAVGLLGYAAVGLAIVGAGVFNLWRGLTARFRKRLKLRKMGEVEDRVFTAVGVIGHLARGLVFGLIGFFLVRAAYQYDAKEAIGLDGALAKVLEQDYGDTLLGFVAAGLLAYGL